MWTRACAEFVSEARWNGFGVRLEHSWSTRAYPAGMDFDRDVLRTSTLPPDDSEAYASHVEFLVLGAVEGLRDGVSVRLGGPKQRTVLALLLAEAGRTVSVDRFIDLIWGEEPTPGARSTLTDLHLQR